jgi:hypothetical protein
LLFLYGKYDLSGIEFGLKIITITGRIMGSGASGGAIDWAKISSLNYIGIALGLVLIVLVIVLFVRMRKVRRECRQSLAERYEPGEILCHDNMANYFGMEVYKSKQIRGNGVLILAKTELYFLRLYPKKEIIIPLKRIKKVITPKSFLGKTVAQPLLKVEFKDEGNNRNSVAWYIKDVDSFKTALKQQIKIIGSKKKKVS